MIEPKLVSVVIPCYNYGRFLGEAIESVLAQTYSRVEVVVVDDGSTDDTAAVAQRYADRGVRYVAQKNSGPAAARNVGGRQAKGELIMFLDADDKLEPTYVEECMAALESDHEAGFAYTQVRLFGREQLVSHFPTYSVRRLAVGNYIHASMLMRRAVVERFQYDETMRQGWEDWDFILTLAEHGVTGVLVDRPLLLYRKHEGGGSINDNLQSLAAQQRRHRELLRGRHGSLYPWYLQVWVEIDYLIKRFKARVKRGLGMA